jgi:asparagine synthase (glutamine-hydrolysing)
MGCLVDMRGSVALGCDCLAPELTDRLYATRRVVGGDALADGNGCFLTLPRPGSGRSASHLWQNADGCVTLFTGYLFDRENLARDLARDPIRADVDLAANWIARYGPDRLGDLAGDFALAHWNPGQRRLVLAVAPLAGRLLYWHRDGDICHFATTVAVLHQIPSVPRILDPLQLTARFTSMVGDPARTVYKDIHQVLPGGQLTVDDAGCRHRSLWRPDPNRRLHLPSDGAYVEAAQALLDRAVTRRLQGAVAPSFLASGGLDSTAMLTTAARLAGDGKVRAYTIVPPPGVSVDPGPGWYGDEGPKIAALARHLPNLDITFCHSADPSALETDPTRQFLVTGLPSMIANQIGWLGSAFEAIRRGRHDVVLNGTMGNFTLSYDGHLCFADLMRAGRPFTALRLLRDVARYKGRSPWTMARHHMLLPLIPDALFHRLRRWRGRAPPLTRHSLIRPDWMESVKLVDYLADHGEGPFQERSVGSREQIIHFIQHRRAMALPNAIALEAIHGIHLRDVFADRDLVEFCLAIPREQFIADGRDRSLARRLLADRAPDCITNETRPGQQNVEWNHRMTPQLDAFAADIDSFSRHPLISEMMDVPRMRQMLADWPSTDQPHASMRMSHNFTFSRAIHTGRFIRWASGSNQ